MKGLFRIVGELLHPIAQLRHMHAQVLRSLHIGHASLLDQAHSLKLELAGKLPSLHDSPPAPSKHLTRCLRNRVQAILSNYRPYLVWSLYRRPLSCRGNMAFSLPYFDVRFVGAILVKARPKRNISATIVADVKRFSHQINSDEVFGTNRWDGA